MVGSGHLYATPVAVVAGSPREDGAGRGRAALEQTLRGLTDAAAHPTVDWS